MTIARRPGQRFRNFPGRHKFRYVTRARRILDSNILVGLLRDVKDVRVFNGDPIFRLVAVYVFEKNIESLLLKF